jgi:hypothetical protein
VRPPRRASAGAGAGARPSPVVGPIVVAVPTSLVVGVVVAIIVASAAVTVAFGVVIVVIGGKVAPGQVGGERLHGLQAKLHRRLGRIHGAAKARVLAADMAGTQQHGLRP